MKNNQKGFASFALIVVIVAAIAIGGYLVLKTKQQPVVQQVPVTSTDETANWKTYTNDEYGFKFNYPSDLSVTFVEHVSPHGTDLMLPCDGSKGVYAYDSCGPNSNGIVIEKDGAVGSIMNFSIFTKPMINLESYAQNLSNSSISNGVISEYLKTKINGVEIYEIHSSTSGFARVHLQNSKKGFMFIYSDSNAQAAKAILSTFKFTK